MATNLIGCLSGFGFSGKVFENLFPDEDMKNKLEFFDYLDYPPDEFFADKFLPVKKEIVIGWSLGGLVALHLIALNKLQIKKLLLLAPPLFPDVEKYRDLQNDFADNYDNAISRFIKICAFGGGKKNFEIISEKLTRYSKKNCKYADEWLSFLVNFNFMDINFGTLLQKIDIVIFMAMNDKIISENEIKNQEIENQGIENRNQEMENNRNKIYKSDKLNINLVKIPNSPHAIHLYNPDLIRKHV